MNSGSEANDLAMMMARLYTRRFDIISFRCVVPPGYSFPILCTYFMSSYIAINAVQPRVWQTSLISVLFLLVASGDMVATTIVCDTVRIYEIGKKEMTTTTSHFVPPPPVKLDSSMVCNCCWLSQLQKRVPWNKSLHHGFDSA